MTILPEQQQQQQKDDFSDKLKINIIEPWGKGGHLFWDK